MSTRTAVSRERLPRPATRLLAGTAAVVAVFSAAAQAPKEHVRELGELNIKELMELEVDSVFAASRYLQKSERAPSATTVITSADIKRFGARTLADVINSVRGMYAPNDRNYTYLGIRGFQRPNDYNTRVLVLVDGHRMNDNIYDLGFVGRETIDIDLIERVEVIRGPSSSIYGSSAFLGVINVVTKRGVRFDGLEASAEAGTFDTYDSRMTFGTTFANGVEWLISGSRHTSGGASAIYFPEFDQRISSEPRAANDGVAEGIDAEEARSFFSSVRFGDLTMSLYSNTRLKDVPTASYGTVFNDDQEETRDHREYFDVRYDRRLTDGLTLQARAFYDEYAYEGVYPYDFASSGASPDIVLNRDSAMGRWLGAEAQLTSSIGERHTLVAGAEYRDNRRENQTTYYDIDPRVYDVLVERESSTLGVFAQSESRLTDELSLTAGIRYDRFGNGDDTFNPRLALIYGLDDTATLKLMYGEAFRSANPYERYYYANQTSYGELQPETIKTYEVAFEKELTQHIDFVATAYSYHVTNLISVATTPADDLYFANLDGVHGKGVEVEVNRRFDGGIGVRASYAVQHAVDELSGRELSSSPKNLVKLNVGAPLRGDALGVGFEVQYHGASITQSGVRADDFLLSNVTLIGKPTEGLELSLSIYNVFDQEHAYPGGADHAQEVIPQSGRLLQGGFAYKF
jgi:outer membrane receptor for ferrienterochelin and colicins